jgi:hypothetical protein
VRRPRALPCSRRAQAPPRGLILTCCKASYTPFWGLLMSPAGPNATAGVPTSDIMRGSLKTPVRAYPGRLRQGLGHAFRRDAVRLGCRALLIEFAGWVEASRSGITTSLVFFGVVDVNRGELGKLALAQCDLDDTADPRDRPDGDGDVLFPQRWPGRVRPVG